MKRSRIVLVAVFSIVLLLGLGFFVAFADSHPDIKAKQGFVSIEGTTTCLPKKGDGPHTMECAIGLKAVNGNYYSFETEGYPDTNQKVTVSGKLTPAEPNTTYDIVGVITGATVKKH